MAAEDSALPSLGGTGGSGYSRTPLEPPARGELGITLQPRPPCEPQTQLGCVSSGLCLGLRGYW